METKSRTAEAFHDYRELWTFNLQKIEDIEHTIEASLHDLENRYADFDTIYGDIIAQLDLLSAIYAGYNTVEGNEYVMRLKSVLKAYGKQYTREGLDFNLIHFLLDKIAELRDRSFEQFPRLSHADKRVAVKEGAQIGGDYLRKKYRWITFERSRSWFMASFTNILILKNKNYPVESLEAPDYLTVNIGNAKITIKDIFTKFPEWRKSPAYYILLDDKEKNFSADRIGKRIYTDTDIVMPKLRPFMKIESTPLSPGRVRMFGINHILLY